MDKILLFWSTSKSHKNFGDELSPYIISKLSGNKIDFVFPFCIKSKSFFKSLYKLLIICKENNISNLFANIIKRKRKHILGLGSIINRANSNSIIWGSGIIVKNELIQNADFRAVRGPLTQMRLKSLGYMPPIEMGDPGLLISKIFKPLSKSNYKVGIIPHINDYEFISSIVDNDKIRIINLKTDNVEDLIEQINTCELIVSSSLHGIITSHAYGIPALWFRFGNSIGGDDVKFYDYYYSVEIFDVLNFSFTSCCINNVNEIYLIYAQNKRMALPSKDVIELRCNQLLKTAPFKLNMNFNN